MVNNSKRPSWSEYFFDIVDIIASRATCDRQREGCIIVRDYRPIASGYSGSMPREVHCDDAGHLFEAVFHIGNRDTFLNGEKEALPYSARCARVVNAIENAILQAAREGIRLEGADLFCTKYPIPRIARMISLAGIKRVYYGRDETECFLKKETERIFKDSGIICFTKNQVHYVSI